MSSKSANIIIVLGGIVRSSFYFDAKHLYNAILVNEECLVTENFGDPAKEPKASKLPGTFCYGGVA